MEISVEEQNSIKNFITACNEMISGRFILSDVKVTKILKTIATSEVLYKLFENALINFNFDREYKKAIVENKTNGGYFVLPEDPKNIIALVFCFLLEVDNRKINLQNFVTDNFFSPEGYNISYRNFALNVLVPFRDCVLKALNVDENGVPLPQDESTQVTMEEVAEPQPTIEEQSEEKILLVNLRKALNELYSMAKRSRKYNEEQREEFIIVLNAMHEAINIDNLKIINALLIPIRTMCHRDRNLIPYFNQLTNCIVDFYYDN